MNFILTELDLHISSRMNNIKNMPINTVPPGETSNALLYLKTVIILPKYLTYSFFFFFFNG